MEYTTYLFDFDYTLADSSRGIVICFRNVLERHGHTGITDEQIKHTIGKTLEESFTILTGIDDVETLASYRKEYIKEAELGGDDSYLGSLSLELMEYGFRFGKHRSNRTKKNALFEGNIADRFR